MKRIKVHRIFNNPANVDGNGAIWPAFGLLAQFECESLARSGRDVEESAHAPDVIAAPSGNSAIRR